jgi:hypothetical protein
VHCTLFNGGATFREGGLTSFVLSKRQISATINQYSKDIEENLQL